MIIKVILSVSLFMVISVVFSQNHMVYVDKGESIYITSFKKKKDTITNDGYHLLYTDDGTIENNSLHLFIGIISKNDGGPEKMLSLGKVGLKKYIQKQFQGEYIGEGQAKVSGVKTGYYYFINAVKGRKSSQYLNKELCCMVISTAENNVFFLAYYDVEDNKKQRKNLKKIIKHIKLN